MSHDAPPRDQEILDIIAKHNERVDPTELVEALLARQYGTNDVIEALQRALERRKIALDPHGMVVLNVTAEAA